MNSLFKSWLLDSQIKSSQYDSKTQLSNAQSMIVSPNCEIELVHYFTYRILDQNQQR